MKGDADQATAHFTDFLLETARRFVPQELLEEKKRTHPWVNDRCKKALEAKQEAEGSSEYAEETQRCSKVFREEYQDYANTLRKKLKDLPRGSKQW